MATMTWDEEDTRQQALRRLARERGMVFTKAHRQDCWFLFDKDNQARTARVFYSLDEAAAVLAADDTGAG